MPSVKEHPSKLQPYFAFGLDLQYSGDSDAVGDCPFCGKEGRFYVSQETGQYDCKVCPAGLDGGKGGNAYTFLRRVHLDSLATTPLDELEMIAEERGVSVETLQWAGLVKSMTDGEWVLPTYGAPHKSTKVRSINNLYRWIKMPDKKNPGQFKRRFMGTATFDAGLFGLQFWNPKKEDAVINEGPWDWLRLKEVFSTIGRNGTKFFRTDDIKRSIYSNCNITALPGAGLFKDGWELQYKGKNVILMGDNDYPKLNEKTGLLNPPAGTEGVKRTALKLQRVAKSIRVLLWGEEGYTEDLPDGYDVRDLLNAA